MAKKQLSKADTIWNRAALDSGGKKPAKGDKMLAALLYAHGEVMNGGVLNAVEILDDTELAAAMAGYRFFSLTSIAELLSRANNLSRTDTDLGRHEASLDAVYMRHIPSDSSVCQLFEQHLADKPSDFAPV
jgi:hypothetical protein